MRAVSVESEGGQRSYSVPLFEAEEKLVSFRMN